MESEIRRRKVTSKDDKQDNRPTTSCNVGLGLSSVAYSTQSNKNSLNVVKDGLLSSDEDSFSDALSASMVQPSQRNCDNSTEGTDVEETHNLQGAEHVQIISNPPRNFEESSTNGNVSQTLNGSGSFEYARESPAETVPLVDEERISLNGCVAPDLNFREVPETAASKKKVHEIEDVLSREPVNVQRLRKLALSEGGLINDNIRKRAWAKLVGIDNIPPLQPLTEKQLEANGEYSQVVLDVNRSLKRFPPGIPYDQRVVLQDQLTRLIMRVIIKHPHLRYYQGYHDVAVTVLLVVGEEAAFPIMEKLSTGHFVECMAETMNETSNLLNYIYPLLKRMHPKLYDYMERSGCGTLFCLPWYLTWYGHNLNHYTDVVRLYDYFMSSEKLLPLYLGAAIVVYRKDEIFNVECDMPYIHSLLSNVPDHLPFETLLKQATELYKQFPPPSIEAEVKERLRLSQLQLSVPRSRQVRRPAPLRDFLQMAPRVSRYGLFLATATLVVGLYAYIRTASASPAFFPVR